MKKYNYDLAKAIIEKLSDLDVLERASLGIHEDWFWTAEDVWEDGVWKKELMSNAEADNLNEECVSKRNAGNLSAYLDEKDESGFWKVNPDFMFYQKYKIAGIYGSSWGTPVLEVEMKDGTQKTFNCFVGESDVDEITKIEKEMNWTQGCLSRPVQESREQINIETFKS